MEHGAWSMEHGAWSMKHEAWSNERGMEHGASRREGAVMLCCCVVVLLCRRVVASLAWLCPATSRLEFLEAGRCKVRSRDMEYVRYLNTSEARPGDLEASHPGFLEVTLLPFPQRNSLAHTLLALSPLRSSSVSPPLFLSPCPSPLSLSPLLLSLSPLLLSLSPLLLSSPPLLLSSSPPPLFALALALLSASPPLRLSPGVLVASYRQPSSIESHQSTISRPRASGNRLCRDYTGSNPLSHWQLARSTRTTGSTRHISQSPTPVADSPLTPNPA
ncbi:hypothetical protein BJ875DRAFT_261259 [Amylocarpus encephaloides]|uniref:Uncharacterized protein n=1 Tax=Amylocarpus encephaloides TaxID=45428 RepID=A0A9P7YSM1_9HELO|nr:hypothetical protein BJ875DRAFT_261259 [Amylocarpus encephaloides]